jgi:hypothetical protein
MFKIGKIFDPLTNVRGVARILKVVVFSIITDFHGQFQRFFPKRGLFAYSDPLATPMHIYAMYSETFACYIVRHFVLIFKLEKKSHFTNMFSL